MLLYFEVALALFETLLAVFAELAAAPFVFLGLLLFAPISVALHFFEQLDCFGQLGVIILLMNDGKLCERIVRTGLAASLGDLRFHIGAMERVFRQIGIRDFQGILALPLIKELKVAVIHEDTFLTRRIWIHVRVRRRQVRLAFTALRSRSIAGNVLVGPRARSVIVMLQLVESQVVLRRQFLVALHIQYGVDQLSLNQLTYLFIVFNLYRSNDENFDA